jgi:hypothetical protein
MSTLSAETPADPIDALAENAEFDSLANTPALDDL